MDELLNAISEPTVIIKKKQYKELLEAKRWVVALEAAGVDSWEGYDHACSLLELLSND